MIFKYSDELSPMVYDYEYQDWRFISDDFMWSFPLYAKEGTELFEIVKGFTRDDIIDFRYYVERKEYPSIGFNKDDTIDGTLSKGHELAKQFSENALSDFVFGAGRG